MKTRIVAISDTHNRHRHLTIPDGDILIHAGDLTDMGDINDVRDFNDWLGTLPHEHKLVIAGNHDFCFEKEPDKAESLLTNCTYLLDQAITIRGINFYGSPWQPWFFDWAFNLKRGPEIKAKWDLIPEDVDVLITHGPPAGYLDQTYQDQQVGCADLMDAIHRVRPSFHIFGHIHEAYGRISDDHTEFINASSCTLNYEPINAPIVIDL
ncbi:MAG: metallophosphatase domain-containing protein [Candidatus Promineifilaceae bacterium]